VAAAVLAAIVVTAAGLGSTAKAPPKFRADLSAQNEVPAPKGAPKLAGGRFVGTLKGHTLSWTLKFHTLSSGATAAHIHTGTKGQVGPVIIPLCGPCSSPASGTATVTGAQIAALGAGNVYVNVHTAKNPNGEVRGQTYKR
jgi:hypothetical protein